MILDPCSHCKGRGRVRAEKSVLVKIPPGVDTGIQLRIRGEGESGAHGGPPGDLFVAIHVKEHELFVREGDDLRCQIDIPFVQAALGTEIPVPLIDEGKERVITIHEGIQPGEIIRLKGAGMPSLRRGRGHGDLFVQVRVKTPTKLNQRQRELLMEFAELDTHGNGPKARDFWDRIKGLKNSI